MTAEAAPSLPGPLVAPAWLRAHLDRVHVVDCQHVLGDPDGGRRAYLERHIAGAPHASLAHDLAGDDGPGRHPLPDAATFTATARRLGIRNDTPVVAYDQAMTGGAARLWWLLRHAGKDDVAVLAGGLEAWDGPVAGGEATVPPGDLVVRPRSEDLVDADDVAAHLDEQGRVLVDARAPERFRGEVEPLDPVAGHIPGARNVPYTAPLPDELADTDAEVVAYCGSGVTACVVLLHLAARGRDDAKLYPGSWSDWSAGERPVATGPEGDEHVEGR